MNTFSFLQNILEILFPSRCAACGIRLPSQSLGAICSGCFSEIRFVQLPVCKSCGVEVSGERNRDFQCGACLKKGPSFTLARSLVRYGPVAQQLIHTLKYRADTSAIKGLNDVIAHCDLSLFDDCEAIIPVPLYLQRLQKRGLNQAVVLARLFFPERLDLLMVDALERTVNTTAQTKLSGEKRRKNLAGVFRVRERKNIENKVVCLVDDVFTTGTTVSECSKELIHQGVREVKVLTFARVEVSRASK